MSVVRLGAAFLLCALLSLSEAQAEPVITLPRGNYEVGVRVDQQYDHTREYRRRVDPVTGEFETAERARPMQTLVWYPASGLGSLLRYTDYTATRLTERDFNLTPDQLEARTQQQAAALTRRLGSDAQTVLSSVVAASRDAPMAQGKFPVILYAPGNGGTADENADLFEYLASHGYVVIASTAMGGDGKLFDDSMAGVEPQIADIAFLLAYAHTLPNTDMARTAAMGWSWGGMTNVFAASRDDRIRALISLDGTREPDLTRRIDVGRLTVPWLYLSRTPDTIPQINTSEIDTTFSLLNEAKHADVHQLIMYAMRHVDFTSRSLREAGQSSYDEYSKEEVRESFNIAALYILNFLKAYLDQDASSVTFLRNTPTENGAVRHTVRAYTRSAEQLPPSLPRLAEELARRGFEHTVEVYRAAQEQDTAFTLTDRELKAWGYQLLGRGRARDAAEIFRLWTVLYPADWDAFDSLGEAYEAAGRANRCYCQFPSLSGFEPTQHECV